MSKIDSESPKKPLYLDVGNSSIKGAFRGGSNWKAIHANPNFTASALVQWIDAHPNAFSKVIAASVRKDVQQAISQALKDVPLSVLTINHIPAELLDYETPKTLGIDRFLVCYGATAQTTNAVVVIDAGSALTIDYMDQEDVFHGGLIAPGFSGFADVLTQKAPALPRVEPDFPKNWPGKNTINSLKWGQTGFYKMAIEGVLAKYEEAFGAFDLFITGGQATLIASMLDYEYRVRPFLIFDGMQRLEAHLSE
jgi:type III pantothenate kinase